MQYVDAHHCANPDLFIHGKIVVRWEKHVVHNSIFCLNWCRIRFLMSNNDEISSQWELGCNYDDAVLEMVYELIG